MSAAVYACPHCGADLEQRQHHDSGCPAGTDPTGDRKRAYEAALRDAYRRIDAERPARPAGAADGR